MGSSMFLRDIYLPAGTAVNVAAAKAVAVTLCANATADDLALLVDHHDGPAGITVEPAAGVENADLANQHLATVRRWAHDLLHDLIDAFAASLTGRYVAWSRFDRHPDTGRGFDAYLTGGVSTSSDGLGSYDAWDIVCDPDRLPPGWSDAIGAACGLLHPHGTGPAAHAVTFYAWA